MHSLCMLCVRSSPSSASSLPRLCSLFRLLPVSSTSPVLLAVPFGCPPSSPALHCWLHILHTLWEETPPISLHTHPWPGRLSPPGPSLPSLFCLPEQGRSLPVHLLLFRLGCDVSPLSVCACVRPPATLFWFLLPLGGSCTCVVCLSLSLYVCRVLCAVS